MEIASSQLTFQAGLEHLSAWISGICVLLLGLVVFARRCKKQSLEHVPSLLQNENWIKQAYKWRFHARTMLREGYQRFPIFRIATQFGQTVLVTRDDMVEVMKQPDDVIDFEPPFNLDFQTKYTKFPSADPIGVGIIRTELTPGLIRIVPRLAKEVEHTVRAELPPSEDWTSFHVFASLLRIVAISAGSQWIGSKCSHDERWVHSSVGYTVDIIFAAHFLRFWPRRLRWLGAKISPAIRRIEQHRKDIHEFLAPEIESRIQNLHRHKSEKPDDMMQWTIEKECELGRFRGVEKTAHLQLVIAFVSVHLTAATITHCLYDLAVRPEYVDPLRAELRAQLAVSGGTFDKECLSNCKLLDSFIKESQRMNPMALLVCKRFLHQGIQLSSGTYLPAGTIIATPSEAVFNDSTHFPKPDTFDGYRFMRMRESAAGFNAQLNQLVNSNKTNLAFGFGKHSCPGRFFAATEIKLVLANVLLGYDLKMREEDGGKRYENWCVNDDMFPDPTKHLLLRKIRS